MIRTMRDKATDRWLHVPVIVLGMHRSGTSVITRAINLLGVPLCRAGDLDTPSGEPADGHWESSSLAAFNEILLNSCGGTWSAPPVMADGWELRGPAVGLRDEANVLFNHIHPTPTWVWKDPRACLTLPFWRSVWKASPVVVFVHREPLEVALSLQRRDGFGRGHCIALWERHVRSALNGANGLPFIMVRYSDLMANPADTVARLRFDLESLGVPVACDPTQATACVAPNLGQSRHCGLSLMSDPDATTAHRRLLSLIAALPESSSGFVTPDLGTESSTTSELLSAMRTVRPGLRMAMSQVWPALHQSINARLPQLRSAKCHRP